MFDAVPKQSNRPSMYALTIVALENITNQQIKEFFVDNFYYTDDSVLSFTVVLSGFKTITFGTFTRELAETKIQEVCKYIAHKELPIRCTMAKQKISYESR